MRIVVDTNVIVSALVFGGLPCRVFEAVETVVASFTTRMRLRVKRAECYATARLSVPRRLKPGSSFMLYVALKRRSSTELRGYVRVQSQDQGQRQRAGVSAPHVRADAARLK
jgi:hypothetical protein